MIRRRRVPVPIYLCYLALISRGVTSFIVPTTPLRHGLSSSSSPSSLTRTFLSETTPPSPSSEDVEPVVSQLTDTKIDKEDDDVVGAVAPPPPPKPAVKCPDCDLCDGSGRITGGIGAIVPWIPIKAYRPCPNFIERGGRYTRSGQGLDEIAFGRADAAMRDDN
mmetsp:Transcript_44421/g.53724  ORF Transcript_44421/g.53724 Transcript_44421/m.53724 type:complete len:164 (+) Transcript_44421:180-671(+)|eukprot:CAMPEP_0172500362 /NCGR_PEP_ID=MMETSP1066-20121228/137255_1 /TAXON_ID=671091 /ORGANISM="Coscinodiscus wailesii, Strain CCMP2513" /LENGTH=163 /DNA_ID=CAMNT_0013274549 /DNA_START=180 /DNA_END=671 /DNA_ORIENTATION=-